MKAKTFQSNTNQNTDESICESRSTSGDVKPVLSLAAAKAVKTMMKWNENNAPLGSIEGYLTDWKQKSDGSIVGEINSSEAFEDGTRIRTTPSVNVMKVGYLVETQSGGQYLLE